MEGSVKFCSFFMFLVYCGGGGGRGLGGPIGSISGIVIMWGCGIFCAPIIDIWGCIRGAELYCFV